jgi:uncharacterized membrane protein YccF (DUF307 family)
MLSFLLNILWIIFGGGLVLCVEYLLAGCLLCLTIVGIPFGLQCFKIAGLALWPFGKDIGPMPGVSASEPLRLVFNVIWAIVAGIWIFLTHLVLGVGLAISIIGFPFALQHLKLGLLALAPFGRQSQDAV